jgi:hypothetical protein
VPNRLIRLRDTENAYNSFSFGALDARKSGDMVSTFAALL